MFYCDVKRLDILWESSHVRCCFFLGGYGQKWELLLDHDSIICYICIYIYIYIYKYIHIYIYKLLYHF